MRACGAHIASHLDGSRVPIIGRDPAEHACVPAFCCDCQPGPQHVQSHTPRMPPPQRFRPPRELLPRRRPVAPEGYPAADQPHPSGGHSLGAHQAISTLQPGMVGTPQCRAQGTPGTGLIMQGVKTKCVAIVVSNTGEDLLTAQHHSIAMWCDGLLAGWYRAIWGKVQSRTRSVVARSRRLVAAQSDHHAIEARSRHSLRCAARAPAAA